MSEHGIESERPETRQPEPMIVGLSIDGLAVVVTPSQEETSDSTGKAEFGQAHDNSDEYGLAAPADTPTTKNERSYGLVPRFPALLAQLRDPCFDTGEPR